MTLFFEIGYNQIEKRLRLFSLTVSLCIRMVKQTKLLNYKPKGEEYEEKRILWVKACKNKNLEEKEDDGEEDDE